jgi:hypothetical protein
MKPKGTQFSYSKEDYGESSPMHQIVANTEEGIPVGTLKWDKRRIRELDVSPDFRREGIATAMWQEGHRLASENTRIPKPRHSSDRTEAGDAWAKSVGGRLPRRLQK